MSNHQEVTDLAKTLTGNENLYSVQPFIKITGDTLLGLFLERIVYWSDKSKSPRLKQLKIFYKTAEEWEDELGLSYAQVTRARKELEAKGFIQTSKHRVSGAPTLHYYANMGAIAEAVTLFYQRSNSGYTNINNPEIQEVSISEKPQLEIQESEHSSYNSTYNSTKTTSKEVGDKSPPVEVIKPDPPLRRARATTIPAVQVFVDITGKFVLNNAQIREIDEKVGRDPPALDRWRETVKAWQLAGNKINGISGMLDWFKKGIPIYAQKNGANHGTYQNTNRKGIKALEETGESLRGKRTTDIYTNEYVYPDGHREPIPPVPGLSRDGIL